MVGLLLLSYRERRQFAVLSGGLIRTVSQVWAEDVDSAVQLAEARRGREVVALISPTLPVQFQRPPDEAGSSLVPVFPREDPDLALQFGGANATKGCKNLVAS